MCTYNIEWCNDFLNKLYNTRVLCACSPKWTFSRWTILTYLACYINSCFFLQTSSNFFSCEKHSMSSTFETFVCSLSKVRWDSKALMNLDIENIDCHYIELSSESSELQNWSSREYMTIVHNFGDWIHDLIWNLSFQYFKEYSFNTFFLTSLFPSHWNYRQ